MGMRATVVLHLIYSKELASVIRCILNSRPTVPTKVGISRQGGALDCLLQGNDFVQNQRYSTLQESPAIPFLFFC